MAAGSVQTVLVCQPADVGQAPCPAGSAPAAVQAYVVDASQASWFDALAEPFDYTQGMQIWGFAFTSVMTLYLVARGAGMALGFVRKS